jgi:hypothetical protein
MTQASRTTEAGKRQPKIHHRIELRDESATPGVALMERIAFTRNPMPEDLAIVSAWQTVLCLPVVSL